MNLAGRFPLITEVVRILNGHDIRYGMFCSSAVETITGYRQASDIDLLIDSSDVSKVATLLHDASAHYKSDRIQISLKTCDYIDFFGRSLYYNKYPFFFTDLVWEHSFTLPLHDTEVRILHPLETILVKAIQQRGIEVGKHDFEDARQLAHHYPEFEVSYAAKRLKEIKADGRIYAFLKDINFTIHETQIQAIDEVNITRTLAYAQA